MKLPYYKNLDGVRGIAALLVMVFHFFHGFNPVEGAAPIINKLSYFGQTGVDLFFVLSGFLITRILIHTKAQEGYFKNFYVRRTLRIFPLYYLFLILTYYVLPHFIPVQPATLHQQLPYLTYLQDFAITFNWNTVGPGHFWSLAVEEHYYLFWPLAVLFLSRKGLLKLILGIVLFALLLRAYMFCHGYEVFYFTFTRFDALAIGSALALLELRNAFQPANFKWFFLLIVAVAIPTALIWTSFSGAGALYVQVFKYLFVSLIYFALIGAVLSLRSGHPVNAVLKTRFFSYTGKVSYGLYVYHPIIYFICSRYIDTGSIPLNIGIRFLLTYVVAALSYHLIEERFLKLKKFFAFEKPTIAAPVHGQ
ncbi:MAG: acyltransferase [Flavobacteriales bacterium]|nr:acyltransferase [Flavobacteriales bacterium]